jgi:hypothetical protein
VVKMLINKIADCRALCTDGNTIWVARGMTFWGTDYAGKRITRRYKVGSTKEKIIARIRLSRQLFRVGIHHLLLLNDGGFLVVLKKRTLKLDKNGWIESTFKGYRGNKPAHKGVCITPDGTIFFGEYSLNMKRQNPTSLYKSTDHGRSFQEILTFNQSEIRHIHLIQWDPYEKCLWLGTGDTDPESRLYKSGNNGDDWKLVGSGSQLWRAVGVSFDKDALYWGTDAGSDAGTHPNFIIRMDRKTQKIEKIQEVQGPCHGNAALRDKTILVSTGIEGGTNEKDRFAHLWISKNGRDFKEALKLKKDIFPHIFQYGVIRFPMGLEHTDSIIYTNYGLSNCGETVFITS